MKPTRGPKARLKMKLLYFLSHPIQYFSPMLRELAKVSDLQVYYFGGAPDRGSIDRGFGQVVNWDIPLLEGYQSRFLKNKVKDRGLNNRFWDVWNPGVWSVVRKSDADIILLNGWSYSSTWLVLLAAAFYRKKVWLRAENPLNQELRKSKKVLLIKKLILKYFLFRWLVDKCLYIGSQSKAFFIYYGVDERRLVYTPYAVDNALFQSAWAVNRERLPDIRRELDLPADRKFVVFSGKYIDKKRPLDLMRAFAALDNPEKYFLLMVGEGALRPEMEAFARAHRMQNVRLTGFVNQSVISLYYAIADVFVMCSGMGETWGLSVNEAMNFAKPVIVSDTCGCSADLVQKGVNGFVYEEGHIHQLTDCLKRTLEDDRFRMDAGIKSREIVSAFSIDRIVQNIRLAG